MVDLPSSKKLVKPIYRNLMGRNIPREIIDNGVGVRVVVGEIRGVPSVRVLRGC